MKVTSKLMMGAALVAAMAFVGCANNDDPNDMITKKSSKEYTIDYTNTEGQVSRGYKSTALKHAGGTVIISQQLTSEDSFGAGIMGFIFGLDKNKDDTKNFYIVGLKTTQLGLDYYVSKYENVSDLQAKNFGADEDGAVAKETVYKEAFQSVNPLQLGKIIKSDEETATISTMLYVDQAQKDGGEKNYYYVCYLVNPDTKVDNNGVPETLDDTNSIKIAEIELDNEKLVEKDLAVYANVYPTAENAKAAGNKGSTGCGTLTGSWKLVGTYKESELEY